MSVRGLKVNEIDHISQMQFVDAEFLVETEEGMLSFNSFIRHLASKGGKMIVFTRIHLSGNKMVKPTGDIDVGYPGIQALVSLFQEGYLTNLTELRVTDLCIDQFSMMGLADVLCMNPSLMLIDFSRNQIEEDLAAGIIQRLYLNPCLTKLILDGNPIAVGLFQENVIKPYFNTRKDLKIVLA